jgi:hypothetical protein
MAEELRKIEEGISMSIDPNHGDLTVEKLRELLQKPTMSEEEAKEIIFGLSTLVDIIIDYQEELELKEKNDREYNLNQAA